MCRRNIATQFERGRGRQRARAVGRSHRLSKSLDRATNDRRDLRRTDDLCGESSKPTLAIEPRSKIRVLALKSLDASEQLAGSVI
jgi:hypothetical protein